MSLRAEPRTFNPIVVPDTTTEIITSLLQAKLVRINRATDDVEPWLAESWTRSEDDKRYTFKLRPDAKFSDGRALTADDVVFSLAAAQSYRPVANQLSVEGKPLRAEAVDAHTVTVVFPTVYAPGPRILERLPVLPKHLLEPAMTKGPIEKALGLSTPPAGVVGAGPFVLREYVPGQRVVFARNPNYWRKDAAGTQLPYLDRVVIEIIPDENTQLLRLEAGQSDMMASEVPADAYAGVKRAADAKTLRLYDVGPALDAGALWFNLKPGAFAGDPRAIWLQRDELRRAISMAVDRKVFADTVYLGAGVPVFGPITPANKRWYWAGTPQTPHDPKGAMLLLAQLGLVDRNGDGTLEDSSNRPARFTLVTQKGRQSLERGAAVIRDELKKIGVAVDVAAVDGGALISQVGSAKYEAVYFTVPFSDTDPAASPDFWLSSGGSHLWNMAQKAPATDWEKLMDAQTLAQMQTTDESVRKRVFDDLQETFAEHLPVVYFVAPHIYAASSVRVTNVVPAVKVPQLFWSPDTVAVTK